MYILCIYILFQPYFNYILEERLNPHSGILSYKTIITQTNHKLEETQDYL